MQLQKLLLDIGDHLHPLLKLEILRRNGIFEVHDHVGPGVHLFTSEVQLLTDEVHLVISLAKVVVSDLQLKVILRGLMCPTAEDGIVSTHPLHHV
jgi:hypothetical protein